jgi:hypothetical protein
MNFFRLYFSAKTDVTREQLELDRQAAVAHNHAQGEAALEQLRGGKWTARLKEIRDRRRTWEW